MTPGNFAGRHPCMGFYMSDYRNVLISLLILLIGAPVFAWGHQDVWLRNEQGDKITPVQNSADPYSPRKTCGTCHAYLTITSGYHFQQGFHEMKDRYDEKRPWMLSPGMFGKWQPTAAAGRLAGKVNTDIRQVDLSTYDWIGSGSKFSSKHKVKSLSCGGCHPGGGPLEYGRDAQGKADRSLTLIQAEARSKNSLDGDFSSHDAPDGKSHFRESGVVEADCLICHQAGYRMDDRNEQLGRRNYRWAATAGAGLGTITGAVFSYADPAAGPGHARFSAGAWNLSRRPATAYAWSNRGLFGPDGRLKGLLIRKTVGSKNCLQCHGESDAKNTGALHTTEHDAHVKAGLICTDCHGLIGKSRDERIRHQIAKGRSPVLTLRDDLDGVGMKTCAGCHVRGEYRPGRAGMPKEAKNPLTTHARRFPQATFHTYIIACNGCHANARPTRAMVLLDMSAGREAGYTADHLEGVRTSADYGKPVAKPWTPWMMREMIYAPAVPKGMQWFGEKMPNGAIRPIPLRYVQKAATAFEGLTTVEANLPGGAKEKRRTVVSDRDIAGMTDRLVKMGFRDVVLISDQIYEWNKGKIVSRPLADKSVYYPIDHGVVPLAGKPAYGGKGKPEGCMDCHKDNADFFSKMEIKNIRGFMKNDYPSLKEPNTMPQFKSWGLRGIPAYE